MQVSEKRKSIVGDLYAYVSDIVAYAVQEKRKLIIWGCGKGGAFLTHLILDIDGRMPVAYYIDEYITLPCGNMQGNICRSSLLWYVDPKEYIILLTIRRDESVEKQLADLGCEKDRDYFDIRSKVGGSYLEFLEKKHKDIDFSYVTKEERPDLYSGEYYESKPFDHSSIDHVFEEIKALPCEKRFLDIGCGKGQILLMAAMSEMKKIGGIEWNADIAEICRNNMDKLGVSADIMTGDATEYVDIDGYSIFFFYNPFGENGIRKVVNNILESRKRRNRDIFLVYGNPFYHKTVTENSNVRLYRQVRVDLYDPLLNIYKIGDENEQPSD